MVPHPNPTNQVLLHYPMALWTTLNNKIIRKLNSSIPKLGDIWVIVEMELESCCAQFYKPKIDNKIRIRHRLIRIV
jgi:hypothetical protein